MRYTVSYEVVKRAKNVEAKDPMQAIDRVMNGDVKSYVHELKGMPVVTKS